MFLNIKPQSNTLKGEYIRERNIFKIKRRKPKLLLLAFLITGTAGYFYYLVSGNPYAEPGIAGSPGTERGSSTITVAQASNGDANALSTQDSTDFSTDDVPITQVTADLNVISDTTPAQRANVDGEVAEDTPNSRLALKSDESTASPDETALTPNSIDNDTDAPAHANDEGTTQADLTTENDALQAEPAQLEMENIASTENSPAELAPVIIAEKPISAPDIAEGNELAQQENTDLEKESDTESAQTQVKPDSRRTAVSQATLTVNADDAEAKDIITPEEHLPTPVDNVEPLTDAQNTAPETESSVELTEYQGSSEEIVTREKADSLTEVTFDNDGIDEPDAPEQVLPQSIALAALEDAAHNVISNTRNENNSPGQELNPDDQHSTATPNPLKPRDQSASQDILKPVKSTPARPSTTASAPAAVDLSDKHNAAAKASAASNKKTEQAGVDVAHIDKGKVIDEKGNTPLMIAAWASDNQTVRTLIKQGARVNARNHWGWTALLNATIKGNHPMIKDLLDNGASPNLTDNDGRSPLMAAILNNHSQIVKTLLRHNANVNKSNRDGWSALSFAAWMGDADTVKSLLLANAARNHKTHEGLTPLQLAKQGQHTDVIRLLKQ